MRKEKSQKGLEEGWIENHARLPYRNASIFARLHAPAHTNPNTAHLRMCRYSQKDRKADFVWIPETEYTLNDLGEGDRVVF